MNNNFRAVFYLRGKGYETKDGKSPIQLRIYVGSSRIALGNTGYSTEARMWDSKTMRVSGRSADSRFINSQLDNIETDLRGIYRRLEFSDELSVERIKAEYLRTDQPTETVLQYYDEFIKQREEEVGNGLSAASIQKCKVVRRHFGEYLKLKHMRNDIKFSELNYTMINGFEHFMRAEEGCQNNTIMRMLRTFKTVLLNATKDGILQKDPYKGVRIHFDPVDRGFLTDEELKRMMQTEFEIERLERVRDVFIFSCFTGLAYIDLATLTKDDIVEINGKMWIVTRRQKTNVECHVPLLEIPLMLLDKYKDTCKDDHVLPVMSNQKQNAYLKEIAVLCNIKKNLTCHLARHTFATMALTKDVPIESVSKMLGHTNIKTTQLYARITNKKVENDMKELANKLDGFGDGYAQKDKKVNPVQKGRRVQSALEDAEDAKVVDETPAPEQKKRGRPKKLSSSVLARAAARETEPSQSETESSQPQPAPQPTAPPAKKRGRPRKNPVEKVETEEVNENKAETENADNTAPQTLTPQMIDGKLVFKTPDGRTFVLSEQVPATPAPQPIAPPAKKRGRPRKVQPEEAPAVKSTTAYVDGKMVTTHEPPVEDNKKRQRIPRCVKVEPPVNRNTRRPRK